MIRTKQMQVYCSVHRRLTKAIGMVGEAMGRTFEGLTPDEQLKEAEQMTETALELIRDARRGLAEDAR